MKQRPVVNEAWGFKPALATRRVATDGKSHPADLCGAARAIAQHVWCRILALRFALSIASVFVLLPRTRAMGRVLVMDFFAE
jgi:hypothetical protein